MIRNVVNALTVEYCPIARQWRQLRKELHTFCDLLFIQAPSTWPARAWARSAPRVVWANFSR
jgi:hypothetical protein